MFASMRGATTHDTHHQGDEVVLKADAFYIPIACNYILDSPFIPSSIILSDDFIKELSNEAKELAEWQALCSDMIRASEDSSDLTINANRLGCWQQNISLPLHTPGRIRT
jgi:hypothetical protein